MKKKIIIIALIILVGAALTKPSEENFKNYIKSELMINSNDGFLTTVVKGITKIQSDLTTKYTDKTFFAICESTIGDEKNKFIGVFGFWFELPK